jgi:hypothetical protein
MSNNVIKSEIRFWTESNSFYDNYFSKRFVVELIKSCDIVTQNHTSRDKLIVDFIAGLALLPIYLRTKNEQQGIEFDMLTQPVFNLLIDRVKSDEYRKGLVDEEISGESIHKLNGVESPISQKEILLHIKRMNSIPITTADIQEVERDWIDYKRKQYAVRESEISLDTIPQNVVASSQLSRSDFDKILSEIKNCDNLFWKGLPMDQVVKHFEVLTIKKNKKGNLFLSPEQLVSFLKKGFLNDPGLEKTVKMTT